MSFNSDNYVGFLMENYYEYVAKPFLEIEDEAADYLEMHNREKYNYISPYVYHLLAGAFADDDYFNSIDEDERYDLIDDLIVDFTYACINQLDKDLN